MSMKRTFGKLRQPSPIALKLGLAGRYKLLAHKVDEHGNVKSSRVAADWFSNLITDTGLDNIGITTTYAKIGGCVVGSGNTPPTTSDTSLESFVAATSTIQSGWKATNQISEVPYYMACKITYRFGTGVAAGNLTEVGMAGAGSSSTIDGSTPLFSRALIVDEDGNPTTITILDDEILDVVYELRIYLPNGGNDVTGTFTQTIDGVETEYSYTLRVADIDSNNLSTTFQSWNPSSIWGTGKIASSYRFGSDPVRGVSASPLASITNEPSGSSANFYDGNSDAAYTSGNYYLDSTFNLGLNKGNITFITYLFWWSNMGLFQMQIDPGITKNNTKIYSITVRISWGRYSP